MPEIPEDFPEKIAKFYDLSDSFYKTLINSLDNGVYLVDQDRRVVYWNQSAGRLSGYSANEIVGHFCGDGFLQHVDFEGRLLCGDGCPLKATMEDGSPREADVFMKHKDGHRVPVRVRANPVYDRRGELIGAVETFHDITPDMDARVRIQQLYEAANTDPLTGLTNRRMAEQVIEDACSQWNRYRMPFAILFIDMDDLKKINDSLGHNAGDAAIRTVGRSLRSLFRNEDIVSRWGGDEFIVMLKNVDKPLLEKMIEKTMTGVSTAELPPEYAWGRLSVSVGGTMVQGGDTPETIIARADECMYQAKQRKKSGS
ncbi:MAG TPA: sensor domain-containing diguanylate cyclase [Anaerolineales bacterium]|nr:sensor domain-containing diguanylate cyclase [Anaerolineales bacterium]